MKQFYVLITLLYSTLVVGQDFKMPRISNGTIEYSEVIVIDTLASNQLYNNSQMFVNTTFNSVKDIGQLRDVKNKTITTKGSIPVAIEIPDGDVVHAKTIFTVSIQSRDGKYRYTISNFYFAYTDDHGFTTYASFDDRRGVQMSKKQWLEVEAQTDEFIANFIITLKEKMTKYNSPVMDEAIAKKKNKRDS